MLTYSLRPTAALCINDAMASMLLEACHIIGLRVPEDFSVVKFDDSNPAIAAQTQLTSVHIPLEEVAKAAVELLQSQIAGKTLPTEALLVMPFLVERGSTASYYRPPSPYRPVYLAI